MVWIIMTFLLINAGIFIFSYLRTKDIDLKTSDGYFLGGRSLTALYIGSSVAFNQFVNGTNGWIKRAKLFGNHECDGVGGYSTACAHYAGICLFTEVSQFRSHDDTRLS